MLDVLNKELMLDMPLRIGIGIPFGRKTVVGNGSSGTQDGIHENQGHGKHGIPLKNLTKALQANILIMEKTFSRLKILDNITPEKQIPLRGKNTAH